MQRQESAPNTTGCDVPPPQTEVETVPVSWNELGLFACWFFALKNKNVNSPQLELIFFSSLMKMQPNTFVADKGK